MLWQKFEIAKARRNSVAHPRQHTSLDLTAKDAEDAIEIAEAIIQVVSKGVWGKEAEV